MPLSLFIIAVGLSLVLAGKTIQSRVGHRSLATALSPTANSPYATKEEI